MKCCAKKHGHSRLAVVMTDVRSLAFGLSFPRHMYGPSGTQYDWSLIMLLCPLAQPARSLPAAHPCGPAA